MASSARLPDGAAAFEAMARRFDEALGRARARASAMEQAADELAELPAERRRQKRADLTVDLGGYSVRHGC